MPDLFHVSPPEHRDSIAGHGLTRSLSHAGRHYLAADPHAMLADLAEGTQADFSRHDIWQVDARGLELHDDPESPGHWGAVYTTQPVGPERLRRQADLMAHFGATTLLPIEQVGKMRSSTFGGTVEDAYANERYSPREQHYARQHGYSSAEEHQDAVRDHVAEHGIGNALLYWPDRDGHPLLGNGHHRYFAARDLGLTHLPVTQENQEPKAVPGWDDEKNRPKISALMAHFGEYRPDPGWTFYHGTPDIRTWGHGAHYGIHVGTEEAARQALHAKIGEPAEGTWDGTREYGKTLLKGQRAGLQSGYNMERRPDHYPKPATYHEPVRQPGGGWGHGPPVSFEDREPGKVYNSRGAVYSDSSPVPMDARPSIFPVRITGPMTNHPATPHEDFKANGYMAGALKRGNAKRGYFYRNVGEDEGSISAVVPSADHLERLDQPKTAGLLAHFAIRTLYHGTDEEFGPGEVVEPGHESRRRDPGGKLIWMHEDPAESRSYGKHLYEVEPTGILYDDSGDGGRGSWSSTSPARVVRKVSLLEHMAAWYHGTAAELEPGEMVEPGHKQNFNLGQSTHVHMTDQLRDANWYARTIANSTGIGDQSRRYHPHVYEVEPTGEHERDPVGEGSNDRRSRDPLRVVRKVSLLEHFAAAGEGFPNPYHGTVPGGRPEFSHTWFHGTKQAGPQMSQGRPLEKRYSEHESWPQPNKLLGTHFSPLHSVAHGFAFPMHGSRWTDPPEPGRPSALVHARLRFRDPAHFPSEDHLNLAVAQWASKHHPLWHNDKLNNFLAGSYQNTEGTHRDWFEHEPGGTQVNHGLPDAELAQHVFAQESSEGRNKFLNLAHQAQHVMSWHPHLPEILRGFTDHLHEQGHHGITYGNNVEGPMGSVSAIATHPSQIETTHVEHIAAPDREPEPHEVRYSREGDVNHTPGEEGAPAGQRASSDLNEPEDFNDKIERLHTGQGKGDAKTYPRQIRLHPGYREHREAAFSWLKSEFEEPGEEPDEREITGDTDWSQGWPGFPHEKKRRKKTAAYYHGTHLDLQPGDTVEPGHPKNWGYSKPEHLYLSTNPWGAGGYGDVSAYRHGMGTGKGRTYEVEPTGPVESDENSRGHADYEENRVTAHPARVIREVPREEARQISMRRRGSAPAYDGPWYHGTAARLGPGAMIEPGHKAHGVSSKEHVYLAGSDSVARTFGGLAAVRNKAKTYSIYQVEPTGPTEPDPDGMGHRSRHPLRVIRLHERGASPEDPNPWWNQPGTGKGYPKQAAVPGRAFDADAEPGPFEPGAHPGPFLHGGPTRVEPGDVIRNDARPVEWGRLKHNFFTTSRAVAEDAADMRNGRGHGWIHTVEPTDSYERDYGEPDSFRSRAPLRVLSVDPGRLNGSTPHPPVVREAAVKAGSHGDDFTEASGYVGCDQGHEHWGPHGASFLLLRHHDPADATQRYLLQKRTSTGATDHGGTWALPGGALQHEGEDSYAAARREAREEMGPLPRMKHHHTVRDDHGGWFADTHVADVQHRFQPHGEAKTGFEAEGHAWFTHPEIQDLKDKGALHPGFAATWDTVRRSRVDKEAAARSRQYVQRMHPKDLVPYARQEAYRTDDPGGLRHRQDLAQSFAEKGYKPSLHGGMSGDKHFSPVSSPITLVHEDDRSYLEEGHHRTMALDDAGYDKPVPVLVKDFRTPKTAVVTPGSLPPGQQAAFDAEDHREHRRRMLDVAKNPPPGTRVWRGEIRRNDEDPASAPSAGMHWSASPDPIITGWAPEGHKHVVWQGIVEHHDEQAFPRKHPIWSGRHESMDFEAEVRFRPGAHVKLEGAYVHEPKEYPGGLATTPGHLVPRFPERTHPDWKWHPLDRHIEIRHAGHGASDYSELGIPREAARTYRLWRGEGSHDEAPVSEGSKGRWFTPDRVTAEDYAYQNKGHLYRLDVSARDKEHIAGPGSVWKGITGGGPVAVLADEELAARKEHHAEGCPSCDPEHDETHRHQRAWLKNQGSRQLPVTEIGPLYHGTTDERAGRILERGFEGGTVHLTPHADLAHRYAEGRVIKDQGGTPAVLKVEQVRGVSGSETGYMDPEMSRQSGADYQDKGPEVVVLNPAAIHGITRHAVAEPAMVL